MNHPTRRTSGIALALLIAFLGTVVACSSPNSTTTAGPPATGAGTTAKADKSDKTERTDKTERSETTRTTRRSTTTSEDDENGTDPGEDDSSSTTARRSSSTTSRGGGGNGSITTITVKPTSGNETFCNTMADEFNKIAASGASASDEAGLIKVVGAMYQKLTDIAPPEIQSDFETLNKVFQNATSIDDIIKASKDPSFLQAAQRLQTWLTTNCGVNPQLPIN